MSRLGTKRRWLLVAAAAAAVLSTSFSTVSSDEQAVVERFGRAARTLLPGFHLKLPWPLERVRRVPGAQASRPMTIGYRLIDDINGIAPPPAMTQWLTGDSSIVEVQGVIRYRVVDPKRWLYGASWVSTERELGAEPPEFALRRLGEAAFAELCASLPSVDLITGGGLVLGNRAKALIEDRAKLLGVEITDFQIQSAAPIAAAASAFRRVQDAEAARERDTFVATREKAARISKGKVDGEARISEAKSEAARSIEAAEGRRKSFVAIAAKVGDLGSPGGRTYHRRLLRALYNSVRVRMVQQGTPEQPTIVFDE